MLILGPIGCFVQVFFRKIDERCELSHFANYTAIFLDVKVYTFFSFLVYDRLDSRI